MKEEIDDSPRGIGRSTNRRHVSPVDNEPASISRGTGYTIHRSVLPAVLQPRTKLVTFVGSCSCLSEGLILIWFIQLVWDSSAVPSGHIFVSFGFPEITTMCKEQCRKEKVVVHAVSVRYPALRSSLVRSRFVLPGLGALRPRAGQSRHDESSHRPCGPFFPILDCSRSNASFQYQRARSPI